MRRRAVKAGDRREGRRIQAWVEKHVTNPPMRAVLLLGIAPRAFALLETTGRKTGRRRWTPVGNGLDGRVFWLVSEKGEGAGYVRNLLADPTVRVKVGRRWRTGRATPLPDDDGMARRHVIDRANGILGRLDGAIFKASAIRSPLTIRVDLDDAEQRGSSVPVLG